MAHNAYLLSPVARGGTTASWPAGGTVYKEDFAWLAKGVFESVNGDQGGTWAPAAQIVIGGAGLSVTVTANFAGITCTDLTATGNIQLGDSLSDALAINATSHFYSPVTIDKNTVIGATGSFTLTVNATTTFNNHVTFSDAQTFSGTPTFNSNVVVSATSPGVSIGAPVSFAAGGQVLRRTLWLSDASGSAKVTDYDNAQITGLTDDAKVFQLKTSGADEGSQFVVTNYSTLNHFVTVSDEASTFSLPINQKVGAVFEWHSGAWTIKYRFTLN